MIFIDFGLLRI